MRVGVCRCIAHQAAAALLLCLLISILSRKIRFMRPLKLLVNNTIAALEEFDSFVLQANQLDNLLASPAVNHPHSQLASRLGNP